MMKNSLNTRTKTVRFFALLLVAAVLMTTVGFAKGVSEIVNNTKEEIAEIVSGAVVIGVIIGCGILAMKRNFMVAGIVLVVGLIFAYLISKPDVAIGIINNTLGGIVG